ncbi:MAG: dihydrodipicolinate synthase family protein, partial [Catenulispora sp.]
MSDHYLLHGILPVLQIPFTGAGAAQTVDEVSLRAEVEFCIRAAAHGFVVPALASEFMVLTPEERRQVVTVVVAQADDRVPVVANVAAASAQEAVAYATHARDAGAAAVMALPPYVRRPGADGIFAYYDAIARAARLPVVIQNAPPPFGV